MTLPQKSLTSLLNPPNSDIYKLLEKGPKRSVKRFTEPFWLWFRSPGIHGTILTWIPFPRYLRNHPDLDSVSQVFTEPSWLGFRLPGTSRIILTQILYSRNLPHLRFPGSICRSVGTPGTSEPYWLGFRLPGIYGTILTWIPSSRYLQNYIDLDSVFTEPFALEVPGTHSGTPTVSDRL